MWLQKIPKEVIDSYAYLENQSLFLDVTFDQIIKDIYFFPDKGSFLNFPDKNEFNNDLNKITIQTFLNDPLQQNIQGVLKINNIGYLVDTSIESRCFFKFSRNNFSDCFDFCFYWRAILNLMPCVFPVISLKVLSFVSMGGDSHDKIRKHAYAFSAGVLFTFLTFAVSIILLKQGWILDWMGNISCNHLLLFGFLSLLMVFLALVLITENSIGDSLTKLGNIQTNNDSYLSSLFTGVLKHCSSIAMHSTFYGSCFRICFFATG